MIIIGWMTVRGIKAFIWHFYASVRCQKSTNMKNLGPSLWRNIESDSSELFTRVTFNIMPQRSFVLF